jgi:hypothetical protein
MRCSAVAPERRVSADVVRTDKLLAPATSSSAPLGAPAATAAAAVPAPAGSAPPPPPPGNKYPRPPGNPPYWEACDLPYDINISVTVPYCRRPQSVMQAVRSVLEQTISDVEVCVVRDDESGKCQGFPDELVELSKADPRVVLMSNKGANEPTPRNIGFKRGLERNYQYFASLDDDDGVVPWRFCTSIKAMREANAALACADSYGSEANKPLGE